MEYTCSILPLQNFLYLSFGRFSKIPNAFLFLFLIERLVIRARIDKMLVRIANMDALGLRCLSRLFFAGN